jgi:hypothetical protein
MLFLKMVCLTVALARTDPQRGRVAVRLSSLHLSCGRDPAFLQLQRRGGATRRGREKRQGGFHHQGEDGS